MIHHIKENDRRPAASTVLKRGSTIVTNLDTATSITFRITQMHKPYAKVSDAAVVTDAPTGAVEYQWAAGDTDTIGNYRASWIVLWADGTEETFPTIGYDIVHVDPSLEVAP
jgi:hypothetical protein